MTALLVADSYVARAHRRYGYRRIHARLVAMRDSQQGWNWADLNGLARWMLTLCLRAAEREAGT